MKTNDSRQDYQKQKKKYNRLYKSMTSRYNLISRLRLIIFIGGVTASCVLFYNTYPISGTLVTFFWILTFITLVFIHSTVADKRTLYKEIITINEDSIKRLDNNWIQFTDTGKEFIDINHRYSYDMDLFGNGSLFQKISTTNTYHGRQILKDTLLARPADIQTITRRQNAIRELAEKPDWRQQLQAIGLISKSTTGNNPEKLLTWCEQPENIISSSAVKKLIRFLPAMTILSIIASWGLHLVPAAIPFLLLLAQLVIGKYNKNKINEILSITLDQQGLIATYQKLFLHIEAHNFYSDLLTELTHHLTSKNAKAASTRIRKLESICGYIGVKLSSIHPLFNLVFLWDYQCLFALESWKANSGSVFRQWLNSIGELETLSSFAILQYDHPDWSMPGFSEQKYVFDAKDLGHPLLSDTERKCNDITFQGEGKLIMITGSNMSGKSTMLRTIGINLVLAYSGAPVCASSFECSIMNIYSSMRTVDNITNNVSSFYAELLRIKMVLDALEKETSVLYILDEIFKGTNSRDRKKGAIAVINKLTKTAVTGIVSTHDLELTELENDPELNIDNYYFKETYKDEKIIFDYKMRRGISDTSDVQYLMKMIGLDIE